MKIITAVEIAIILTAVALFCIGIYRMMRHREEEKKRELADLDRELKRIHGLNRTDSHTN